MADIKFGNMRISELQGRADFADLMAYGLNPLLLEGANEEPSQFETIFQRFELTRNNIPFPTYKGLVVGKITEGQEIPFVSLGTGTQTISAEDYGVRAGFTHQMIRDDQVDVMRYTTQELGKAHTRTKNKVAFAALEAGAGHSVAAKNSGTLSISDIRNAKCTRILSSNRMSCTCFQCGKCHLILGTCVSLTKFLCCISHNINLIITNHLMCKSCTNTVVFCGNCLCTSSKAYKRNLLSFSNLTYYKSLVCREWNVISCEFESLEDRLKLGRFLICTLKQ